MNQETVKNLKAQILVVNRKVGMDYVYLNGLAAFALTALGVSNFFQGTTFSYFLAGVLLLSGFLRMKKAVDFHSFIGKTDSKLQEFAGKMTGNPLAAIDNLMTELDEARTELKKSKDA